MTRLPVVVVLATALQTALVLTAPGAARATQGAPGGEAEARRHYQRGEAHFKAGRFSDALDSYEAGYQAAPLPGFLVNIAHCYRRMGDLRRARASYQRFVLVAPDSPLVPEVRQLIAEIDSLLRDLEGPTTPQPVPPSASRSPLSRQEAVHPPSAGRRGGEVAGPTLDLSMTSGLAARPAEGDSQPGSSLSLHASSDASSAPAGSWSRTGSSTGRSRWWLWGAVAATVVGGSVAAWALLSTPDPTIVHDGSLATLRR